jgi:SpoVK/Ycf46/Vps4 family AAA+-type ATPase
MIQFDVLEPTGSRSRTNYDVFTDSQDVTGHKKESKGTLDDFLDKVDIQTIKVEDGSVAFHIRTKPIRAERKWWHALLPDCGLWKYLKDQYLGKTIDKYFGVDMEGTRSRVTEHSTPEGVILDIFGNVPAGLCTDLMIESYHDVGNGGFLKRFIKSFKTNEPNSQSLGYSRSYTTPEKKQETEDKGRQRREIAKCLEKVARIYEKLGIRDGRLVLSPAVGWRDSHLTSDLSMEITESDEFRNCTFYDVALLEREEERRQKRDSEGRKPRIIKRDRSQTDKSKKDNDKNSDSEDVRFKDVVGVDSAIAKLKNARQYFDDPKKFREERGYGLSPGCILYGPPGTGKTMLAKAFANETKAPIIVYKASEILSKYVGDSDKNIESLFAEAERVAEKEGRCVVLVDEFEQIARKRGQDNHEVTNRLVDYLLTYLDGFSERGNVYVIAATNVINEIDPALRNSQGGRLEEIEIPLPDCNGRKKIVSDAVSRIQEKAKYFPFENLDYEAIARASEGLSGRLLVSPNQSILRTLADRYHDSRELNPNTPKATTQDWLSEIRKYKPEDKRIGFGR